MPVVLSPAEVVQFLDSVKLPNHRAILTTCYAAGLRISEAVHLTIPAIDSQRVVFTIPEAIAVITLQNKAVLYRILFRAAAETLRTIAADAKHLGAAIGFFGIDRSNICLRTAGPCQHPGAVGLRRSRPAPTVELCYHVGASADGGPRPSDASQRFCSSPGV